MKLVHQKAQLVATPEYLAFLQREILTYLEIPIRTCYKSEGDIKEGSAEKIVRKVMQLGHLSVLEHVSISARIICSRASSHQIVRHRLNAFSQESQRYCDYTKEKFDGEVSFIIPMSLIGLEEGFYDTAMDTNDPKAACFVEMCILSEGYYNMQRELGMAPEEARGGLTNDCKTELIMTCNLRQWLHVFEDRALNPKAQASTRSLFVELLRDFAANIPLIFDDLYMKIKQIED